LAVDAAPWAVVFAGGIGSRFWPLATPARPKPVLALLGGRPLVAETVARFAPLVPADRVLVVTSRDIAAAVRAAVPEVPEANVLVEPRPLGTAAALAWAAHEVRARGGPRAVLIASHCDLAVAFPDPFRRGLARATALALRDGALVSLAAPPTRPEEQFGYISPGDRLDVAVAASDGGAFRAAGFTEKPSEPLARSLIAQGALWHAGVVVAVAQMVLDDLAAHAAEVAPGLPALQDGNLPVFAGMIRPISLERGLLERTPRLLGVPVDCGWDDVGTWACLRRARDLDDHGNGAVGTAHFVDSTSNVVHTEAGTVVLYGCERMLVVALPGITFVTPVEKARELKPLLDALPGSLRLRPDG
jgi:mannose-1-phosphate guanylyltransferase